MKSNKTAVKDKDLKKATKKELQQSLSNKFFEAVKSLGHDAERIGDDLILVSKFVAKKLSRKATPGKKAAVEEVKGVVSDKPAAKKKQADVIKPAIKGAKKAHKVVQKASASAKSVVNSVKVAPIDSEGNLKEAIAKPVSEPQPKVSKAAKSKATTTKEADTKATSSDTVKSARKRVKADTKK
jgi:hypothetical protein